MNRAARATIDTAALRANLGVARRMAPGSRLMAVIKANAYGHGLVPVARALGDADAFGVARLEEAAALRRAGLDHPVVLLEGIFHPEQLGLAGHLGLDLVVHAPYQLEMLEAAPAGAAFRVWLKIDTGMHRLGFPPEDAGSVRERLEGCRAVRQAPVLMTHLACADDPGDPLTGEQIRRFAHCTAGLPGARSIANSAGLAGWPDSRADWVRPGILLYGVSPFPGRTGAEHGVVPVMTLATELIAVKQVRAGGRVGYGGVWTAPADGVLGVAAIGYGDGYTRHLVTGTPVLVAGHPTKVIGRISMDLLTLDLEGVPDPRPGDEVVLWGRGLPVEPLAVAAGTIPYELLCGVTQRVAMDIV